MGNPNLEVGLTNKDLSKGELPLDSYVRLFKVAFVSKSSAEQTGSKVKLDKLNKIITKFIRLIEN